MGSQPSYRPLQPSSFFADRRASRPLLPGTVARGRLRIDSALYEGRNDDGELVNEFPFEMSKRVLERGQQRFDIFCSVCHGLTGHGDGRIVQRGFTRPPDFITDLSRSYKLRGQEKKLTEVPVGHIFEVVTQGFGAMPEYATQVPVRDRWAIIGYVKALQYSQLPELRKKMKPAEKGGQK
jgi:mono/diheme cytochrome c family protein